MTGPRKFLPLLSLTEIALPQLQEITGEVMFVQNVSLSTCVIDALLDQVDR